MSLLLPAAPHASGHGWSQLIIRSVACSTKAQWTRRDRVGTVQKQHDHDCITDAIYQGVHTRQHDKLPALAADREQLSATGKMGRMFWCGVRLYIYDGVFLVVSCCHYYLLLLNLSTHFTHDQKRAAVRKLGGQHGGGDDAIVPAGYGAASSDSDGGATYGKLE